MLVPLLLLTAPFARAILTNVTIGTPEPEALPAAFHWVAEEYLGQKYVRSEEKDAYVLFGFEGTRLYLTFPRFLDADGYSHSNTRALITLDGYNQTIDMSEHGPPSYVWAGMNNTHHVLNFTAGDGDWAVIGTIAYTTGEEDTTTTSSSSEHATTIYTSITVHATSEAFSAVTDDASTATGSESSSDGQAAPTLLSPSASASSSASPSAVVNSASSSSSPIPMAVGISVGGAVLLAAILVWLLWRRRACCFARRGDRDLARVDMGGGPGPSWRSLFASQGGSPTTSPGVLDFEKQPMTHGANPAVGESAAWSQAGSLPSFAADSGRSFASTSAPITPNYAVGYNEFAVRQQAQGAEALPNPWPNDGKTKHLLVPPPRTSSLDGRVTSTISGLSTLSSGWLPSDGSRAGTPLPLRGETSVPFSGSQTSGPSDPRSATPTSTRPLTTSPLSQPIALEHQSRSSGYHIDFKRPQALALVGEPAEQPSTSDDIANDPRYYVAPPAYSPGDGYGILTSGSQVEVPPLPVKRVPSSTLAPPEGDVQRNVVRRRASASGPSSEDGLSIASLDE
ncbi:uncharacterized protein SCHCODRAFT_02620672 [Schizophyllum commune H4-8]|uniref:Expressed protein n=1 Tax=Schizophyllum commune (strain H4-8 / FGSC 9210) TaxID=578458 RepID=D8PMU3_SCHCM|nr:uncharacterized protein SCHCODRAFT_02620672 [Schizophyllum commune H4-8]KAI5893029.1 hypothetical protein SCHCODRAFT_02620672 [Schizophyllum commune H4-8]